MYQFKFAKLVRDKIVDHQVASGATPVFRQLTIDEHKRELVKKIIEEIKEVTAAQPEEVASELADVQQALDDLYELYGVTLKDVAKVQAVKREKNGAFKKGLFVEYVEMNDDHEWLEYYLKSADRYPRIHS